MAYYDRAAAEERQMAERVFIELKKQLSKNKSKALDHIELMELDIKTQELRIKKYELFFHILAELTPKGFDIHKPIK